MKFTKRLFTLMMLASTLISMAQWQQKGNALLGSGSGQWMGSYVAISGNGQRVATASEGGSYGKIQVFEFISNSWQQVGLDLQGENSGDEARVVSMSEDGNTIAIGAPNNDANTITECGHLRIYRYNETQWVQLGTDIDGTLAQDYLGSSVSLSADGNTVAVGAPYSDLVIPNGGMVKVFYYDENVWQLKGTALGGADTNLQFGTSVHLSDDGSTLAVGSTSNDAQTLGKVYIFQYNNSLWGPKGAPISSPVTANYFAENVRLSADGTRLAISADQANSGNGYIYYYSFDGSFWNQLGNPCSGAPDGGAFGRAIDLSDDGLTMAVGAYAIDGYKGRSYIFHFVGNSWIEQFRANGESALESFGTSIALSSDGNTMVTGAWGYDDTNTNIGRVLVYQYTPFNCTLGKYSMNNLLNDATGNNDGTLNGTLPDTSRFGMPDSALAFDGVGDFGIITNGMDDIPQGAVSVWIFMNDNTNFPVYTRPGAQPTDKDLQLEIINGTARFTLNNVELASSSTLQPNRWYHIVGTWNGNEMTLYIDGIPDTPLANTSGTSLNNSVDFVLGQSSNTINFANGKMDDLKLFQCALTAEEVNDIFHDGGWGYPDFEAQCFDFNTNTVPSHWVISSGTNSAIANGKFMVYPAADPTYVAELYRYGQVPNNTDSLIIEWKSRSISTQAMHFTGLGLSLPDTSIYFVHMQNTLYDFLSAASKNDMGAPIILDADSMAINTGDYLNKLICTNQSIVFRTQKETQPNVIAMELEFNPFTIDSLYSLDRISQLTLVQKAGPQAAYNWIDNVCLKLVESNGTQTCQAANYQFNTSLTDQSGNNLHLAVENGSFVYSQNRFGIPYRSVYLDGGTQELHTVTPAPALTGDCSVSLWIKPEAYNSDNNALIFQNYHAYTNQVNLMIGINETNGNLFYGHIESNASMWHSESTQSIPDSIWTHVLVVRDTALKTYTLYINSDSVQSFNYTDTLALATNLSVYAISSSESDHSYHGSVDDILVNQCLMNQNQIDSLYQIGGWPNAMCNNMTVNITTTLAACGLETGGAIATVIGGSGQYSYTWSNGNVLNYADSLDAGMHSVNITDNVYGCMINRFFTIGNTEAPSITLTSDNLSCYQNQLGSIDLTISGGSTPYSISWSNGATSEDIENLSAAQYSVTVTDHAGCVSIQNVTLTQPSALVAGFSTTNSSCGGTTGSAEISVSGGTGSYSYNWSNTTTSSIATGLSAGNYNVMVSDQNGCNKTFTVAISDIGAPSIIIDSIASASCGSNGSIYVTALGGSGNYTYHWSSNTATEDLIGVSPETYWLTVTDGLCQAMLEAEIPYIMPETQEICVVTVDPISARNLVVWEKVNEAATDHYNIYREGNVSGEYLLVGAVPSADMSEFIDPVASPFTRSWRYKISAVDACGNESVLSSSHKTIHLAISLGLGNSINLMWDDYDGFAYNTFYINRHTIANGWVVVDSLPTYLHSFSEVPPSFFGLWYTVTVKAPNGCVPTSQDRASGGPYYQSTSNLEDEGAIDVSVKTIDKNKVALFPNPNNGSFVLELTDASTGQYQIVDIAGRILYQQDFVQTKQIKGSHALSRGVYMLSVKLDSGAESNIKMLVQ